MRRTRRRIPRRSWADLLALQRAPPIRALAHMQDRVESRASLFRPLGIDLLRRDEARIPRLAIDRERVEPAVVAIDAVRVVALDEWNVQLVDRRPHAPLRRPVERTRVEHPHELSA